MADIAVNCSLYVLQFARQTGVWGRFCWRPHLLRSATPQERRGKRLTIIVREAPPLEEAHAARAGRLFLAAGAAINQVTHVSYSIF